jgi:hypothetical protein
MEADEMHPQTGNQRGESMRAASGHNQMADETSLPNAKKSR